MKVQKKIWIPLFLALGMFAALYMWSAQHLSGIKTITVYDRHGEILGTVHPLAGGHQIWTSFDSIPDSVKMAFLEQEDRYFYYHPGINPVAIVRAAFQNLFSGKLILGGSTITQQLAKNILKIKNPNLAKSRWELKIKSSLLALGLEIHFSKNEIFEQYLNTIYFGNRTYGVRAAAKVYFDLELSALSQKQILQIVRLPKAPSRLSKFLTVQNSKLAKGSALHFLQMMSRQARGKNVVHTTLDAHLQARLEKSLQNITFEKIKTDPQFNYAAVVLHAQTGDVLALIGSRNFFDLQIGGQFNAALARRQPGSTLKPFTFLAGFSKGMTPETLVDDVATNFTVKSADEAYLPQNFDRRFHGSVSIREALANSYNVPAVSVLNRIGLSFYHELLKKLGFTTFDQSPHHYGLSVTLGSGEVNLLELCNAYAVLARGGRMGRYRVKNDDSLPVNTTVIENAENHISQITQILSDEEARLKTFGFNALLSLDDHQVAVKTGTSHDLKDNWTIGYSPEFVVGIWAGHNDSTSLVETTGATGAAPLWHAAFESLVRGQPKKEFRMSAQTKVHKQKKIHRLESQNQKLKIISPIRGVKYRREGFMPSEYQKILAKVEVQPELNSELEWFLDGEKIAQHNLNGTAQKISVWLNPTLGAHELLVRSGDEQKKIVFHVEEEI